MNFGFGISLASLRSKPKPPVITLSENSYDFGDVTLNTFSASRSYTVSGLRLKGNVTVTAPAGFIVNTDNSNTNMSPISLAPSGGILAGTTIYIKSNPTAVQSYSGNITHSSTDALTQNYSISAFGPATDLWLLLSQGGTNSTGALTQYTIGGAATIRKSFDATGINVSGHSPQAGLTKASNGKFYGCQDLGGANNLGTIFEFDPATNIYTKKIDCTNTVGDIGSSPRGTLVEYNGLLYGVTRQGATAGNAGGIFSYDPATNSKALLFSFNTGAFAGISGTIPFAMLTLLNNKIYGVCQSGGANASGTAWEFNPSNSVFTVLKTFTLGSSGDGQAPGGGLISYNNLLYGTTITGSTGNFGVVYSIDPTTSTYTVLKSFGGGANGSNGRGLFIVNGILYGLCQSAGSLSGGTFWKIDLSNNNFTVLTQLQAGSGAIGGAPRGRPYRAKSNKIYFLCGTGGSANAGSLIEYDILGNTSTKILDLTTATTGTLPQINFPLPT